MNRNTRIKLDDTGMSAIIKLSEGLANYAKNQDLLSIKENV